MNNVLFVDDEPRVLLCMRRMLHDSGKRLLAARVRRERPADAAGACETERLTVGATHAQLGACSTGLWALPQPIVEAIAFHHAPEVIDARAPGLATVVHVADALAREREGVPALLDVAHLEHLGLSARLDEWCAEAVRLQEPLAHA